MANFGARGGAARQGGLVFVLIVIAALFIGARTIAGYVIEYEWWREIGQLPTWLNLILYGLAPVAGTAALAFVIFWLTHARAMKAAGTSLREQPIYAKLSTLALLLLGVLVATATVDTWTVVRYFGGSTLPETAASWRDPVFNQPLRFYFFSLPFYRVLLRLVLALSLISGLLYWLTNRGWQLRRTVSNWSGPVEIEFRDLGLADALRSPFVRAMGTVFLLALAANFYFERYEMLHEDHGFLVGVDYVAENVTLPLQWITILFSVLAAIAVALGRVRIILLLVILLFAKSLIPVAVNSFYVRPNEISIQRPYIERHIQATRSAFGLTERAKEVEFPAALEATIDPSKHRPLLDNVRLWDWRAFHDTVTQIQALRPYYVFADSDVDRYIIDGQLRQVMVTPRELDVRQLGDARTRWINSHFIYTHGYGLVMAEANRITAEGLPVTLVENAPPEVKTKSLKLTRPEIYFGEVTHEPVYVRTGQPEFDYPAGSDNAHTKYAGTGGIPIGSFGTKLAAAVSRGDWNLLLTGYLTSESRMLIRRNVKERVEAIAGFLEWDPDPYLVLTEDGRLVWMIDGYTTSRAHPYSRGVRLENIGAVNYIRNSAKASVDAYNGDVKIYIFDSGDPIIQAYSRLFPGLMLPEDRLPADLRAHARYPELIFRTQAEIYRTYHMRDPESFYNKEDLWDLARNIYGQEARPQPVSPTYVVASLPGSNEPEFLLVIPFTPRTKDNLIGLMVARCDGPNLGELLFLQLSKQQLILGPMQVEARINQDQVISKDLSLWNQQGSQVLRGHMLTLPIENTFLYIEPIYIQASEARMPQLRKVVLSMGNRLIYTDTYEQALAALYGSAPPSQPAPTEVSQQTPAPAPGSPPAAARPVSDRAIEAVRYHLRRYRELASQGKWAEAGKELEALEQAAGK